tara:strand:- start:615 stop:971 length:357 start_codon:yes stop_codon:yes gene_type:complete
MSWITDIGRTVWDWATENVDTIANTVGDYVNKRIDDDERAALLNSQALAGKPHPSLTGYQTTKIKSSAGISTFDDIKEASNTRYASFLYYAKAYLQAKKSYEQAIPIALHRKTGLGSR